MKSSLQNAEEAVDIAQLWSAVRPKEKKQKTFVLVVFHWLFVAGTALATWMGSKLFYLLFHYTCIAPV